MRTPRMSHIHHAHVHACAAERCTEPWQHTPFPNGLRTPRDTLHRTGFAQSHQMLEIQLLGLGKFRSKISQCGPAFSSLLHLAMPTLWRGHRGSKAWSLVLQPRNLTLSDCSGMLMLWGKGSRQPNAGDSD